MLFVVILEQHHLHANRNHLTDCVQYKIIDFVLQVAIIPGTQDHPEDWEGVKNECKEFAEFTHFPRPPFQEPPRKEQIQWDATVNTHYAKVIPSKSFDILVAHSRGCRYALEWLITRPENEIRGALLLNPATKNRDAVCNRRQLHTDSTSVETLLAPLLETSTDEQATAMLKRHREAYSDAEYRRIIVELKLLCSEDCKEPIVQKIMHVRKEILISVLGSKFDPYYTDIHIPGSKNVLPIVIDQAGKERGHYHHIEHPEEIGEYLYLLAKDLELFDHQNVPSIENGSITPPNSQVSREHTVLS